MYTDSNLAAACCKLELQQLVGVYQQIKKTRQRRHAVSNRTSRARILR